MRCPINQWFFVSESSPVEIRMIVERPLPSLGSAYAMAARDTPLHATVRRFFHDDAIDRAACATPRTRDESSRLHDARSARNTAALSGRLP